MFGRAPASSTLSIQQLLTRSGRALEYRLRYSQRKTLALTVDRRGLVVAAPIGLARSSVEAFVLKHEDWIWCKLAVLAENETSRRLVLQDGATIPVQGQDWQLRIEPGSNRARWGEQQIILGIRSEHAAGPVLERALKRRALSLFGERLAHFAPRLGHPVPPLALSSARTRWGSCSRHSGIRLNWRLIHFPLPLLDYVVVHELAHLEQMNHSPRFWAVVESLYPNWRHARAELKTQSSTLPIF